MFKYILHCRFKALYTNGIVSRRPRFCFSQIFVTIYFVFAQAMKLSTPINTMYYNETRISETYIF